MLWQCTYAQTKKNLLEFTKTPWYSKNILIKVCRSSKEENRMYQVIKLDGFLEEVADVTEGPYARKFCFFLGAGASITSGIPAATKLVDLWDEKIRTRFPTEEYELWKNEKEIDENNKYSHYSDYYEKQFSSNPVDGYNFLEKKMKEASPVVAMLA